MKQCLFLLYFYSSIFVFSQISFISQIKNNKITLGNKVEVNFILTIKNKNINTVYEPIILPNFKEFNILDSNISESTNIINGNFSLNLIYQLTLQPKKKGYLIIDPAIIKINKKIYTTQKLYLRVDQQKLNKTYKNFFILPKKNNNNTFIELKIKKKNLYLNESVLCQIILYTNNYKIINYINDFKIPNLNNCIIIPIKNHNNKVEQIKKFNNTYFKIILHNFLLYPIKPGKIIIPSYKIHIIDTNTFFNSTSIELNTHSEKIQVKNFPKNAPKNFIGAVGIFNINLITNPYPILTKNAIHKIAIEVIGNGNLQFIQPPKIIFPNSFEIYNENYQDDYQITEKGITGKIYNSKIIIPTNLGEYIIKTEPFVFFNPNTKHYQTIQPKYLKIQVKHSNIKNNHILFNTPKNTHNILTNNQYKKLPNLLNKYTNFNIFNLIKLENLIKFILPIILLILLILIFYIIYLKFIKIYNIKQFDHLNNNNKLNQKDISNYYIDNSNINYTINQKLNSTIIQALIKNNKKKEYFNEIEIILLQIMKNNNRITSEKEIIKKFGKEKFNLLQKLIIQCQIEKFNPIPNNINLYQFHEKIQNLLNEFKI